MPGDIDISAVATLLADHTRGMMLLALSDGRAFTASELARGARVAPSTASEHLGRLMDAKFVAVETQGRHRYYRLAEPGLVEIMESMAQLAPPPQIRSLNASEHARALARARMCYHHLAGTLGVRLTAALVERNILHAAGASYTLAAEGAAWLRDFGITGDFSDQAETVVVPWHIDWSERKHHIAGALGAALAARLLALGWIARRPSSRAIYITKPGIIGIASEFGVNL
jgi:DNA-binding transcriptional ArsR family regulator